LAILRKPMISQLHNSLLNQFGHQLLEEWTENASVDTPICRSLHVQQRHAEDCRVADNCLSQKQDA
jgi:hypothetical protein